MTDAQTLCPNHPTCDEHGCQRCGYVAILADTEEWSEPLCYDCYEAVDRDPRWHTVVS